MKEASSSAVLQEDVNLQLADLRMSIDNIDAALIYMLSERFSCTRKVGELKAAANIPSTDPSRETAQVARLKRLSEAANLDPVFAEKFLRLVIEEVVRNHELIRSRKIA